MKIAHLLSLALICGVAAGQAEALPRSDVEVTFFKEPALKTVVGSRTLSCGGGGVRTTGRVTRYYVRTQSTCPSGPHGNPTSISCHFTTAGCSANLNRMFAAKPPKKRHKAPAKASIF